MALFEFHCDACKLKFEQIVSSGDPDAGKCPKCGTLKTRKLISAFKVGGRGDLRESTMHGCHDAHVAPDFDHSHSHDHDHGHGDE
jgi:putative FmdB family regulatory protein